MQTVSYSLSFYIFFILLSLKPKLIFSLSVMFFLLLTLFRCVTVSFVLTLNYFNFTICDVMISIICETNKTLY